MKKYIVALFLTSFGIQANTQTNEDFSKNQKTVICGSLANIFNVLIDKDVNEKPIWSGRDQADKSDYAVFVNSKTGTFTIVQFNKEAGCILGVGNKSEIYKITNKPQM